VGSKLRSANMRLAKTDGMGKDKAEGYAKWHPAKPGLNDSFYKSHHVGDKGQSLSPLLVYPIVVE
jgi:hypothetical protein